MQNAWKGATKRVEYEECKIEAEKGIKKRGGKTKGRRGGNKKIFRRKGKRKRKKKRRKKERGKNGKIKIDRK